MAELGVGEVVQITVVGGSAAEVDHFAAALLKSAELTGVLATMPQTGRPRHNDFGTWELVQEFIILTSSGTTSAAIIEGIRALWKRGHAEKQLPAPPSEAEQTEPGMTPQPQQITIGLPADGVTEIIVRLRRG